MDYIAAYVTFCVQDLMDLSEDRSRLDFFMRKRQKLEASDDEACTATRYIKAETMHEDHPSCGYDWPDETCRPSPEPPFCKIEENEAAARGRQSFSDLACKEEALQHRQASPGPSLLRAGSCGAHPPPEVAVKAEEWTGQEVFQDQAGATVKAEAEISCSPFSNGTPPELAASEVEQEASRVPTAGAGSHSLEDHSDRDECKCWGDIKIRPALGQLQAEDAPQVPGFSRHNRQNGGNATRASDQSAAEPIVAPQEARESCKEALQLSETDVEADCYIQTPQSRVQSLRQEASETPWRADSDKSSTEHVDFDVASIDVFEQERILQSIVLDRQRMHTEIAKSLLKKRQSSLAAFLKKDKSLD